MADYWSNRRKAWDLSSKESEVSINYDRDCLQQDAVDHMKKTAYLMQYRDANKSVSLYHVTVESKVLPICDVIACTEKCSSRLLVLCCDCYVIRRTATNLHADTDCFGFVPIPHKGLSKHNWLDAILWF